MARKRRTTAARRASRSRADNQVTLRTLSGDVCRVEFGKPLQEAAMRWNYTVDNRSRWSERQESRDEVSQRAAADLAKLGVTAASLKKLAADLIVEVAIPYRQEDIGWEARIMPWEFLLSAATQPHRGQERLVVVRCLQGTGSGSTLPPRSLSIIQAAPGPIQDLYDFEGEANLIRGSLHPALVDQSPEQYLTATNRFMDALTPRLLGDSLAHFDPDVIHLTGVDTHLGAELLKRSERGPIIDGLLLGGEREPVEAVHAEPLADLLTGGGERHPHFVGFNVWYSANRLAPLTIAKGARAAVAFQTSIDDALAELFFVNFYRNWRESGWNMMQAFLQAFDALSHYRERLRGTSIVLWSAAPLLESLLPPTQKKGLLYAEEIKKVRDEVRGDSSRRAAARKLQEREADADDILRDAVLVTVDTEPQLNYGLLHNRRSILRNFSLRFVGPDKVRRRTSPGDSEPTALPPVGIIRDIEIEIILHVGAETFPYRTNVEIGQDQPFLSIVSDSRGDPNFLRGEGIRVPLTSQLARSVDERMQTSLYVNVTWRGQVLYRHTHAVSLQPVDEWMLDDRDIAWVPSFVQPRDAAVSRIVQSAQKYLKCISDYIPAGFDGYQSFDPDGETTLAQWLGVDNQVQALWHALVLDHPLNYINPPPSYRDAAQRLRTPSQILAQGRGTCVDLAILMCSCLEWIEVYPVLFLLDEHAFPGYWRSEVAYNDFISVSDAEASVAATPLSQAAGGSTPRSAVNEPWISGRNTYLEIKRYIDEDLLVPLETVSLTAPTGFQEAIDEVRSAYFSKQRNGSFYGMVNIMRAREMDVTPLPLCNST